MPLEVLRPHTYPSRLVSMRRLAAETYFYAFELDAHARMPLTAGQFVMLHAPQADGHIEKRPYSVVNAPEAGATDVGFIELCVKYLEGGAATTFLQGLSVGDAVDLEGPFGRFTLRPAPADTPRLFVATGTGIAPFMGMLAAARAVGVTDPLTVLHGYRTEDDVLYAPELAAMDGVRVLTTLSKPGTGWTGLHGRVTDHLPGLLQPAAQVYLCGNPAMVEDAKAQLVAAGLLPAQIILEKFTTVGKQRAKAAG